MPEIAWVDLTDEHAGASLVVPFSWAPEGLPFVFREPGNPSPVYDWTTEIEAPGHVHVLEWPDGTVGEVLHADDQLVELVDEPATDTTRGTRAR